MRRACTQYLFLPIPKSRMDAYPIMKCFKKTEPSLLQLSNFDIDHSSVFEDFNAEEVFKMVLEDQSKNNLQDDELGNSESDTDNNQTAVDATENKITLQVASSMLNQLINFAYKNFLISKAFYSYDEFFSCKFENHFN
ncbi:hypothetical protein RN001_002588 [Aquatica leii]|uniref:Uncharacterized protein n=1 Tax=Aquatica leii TaxID=1421715 RepID=A0AAN7PH45_9COLE|nr:hypothetical protein RN001_002588 [Aquatica leii]